MTDLNLDPLTGAIKAIASMAVSPIKNQLQRNEKVIQLQKSLNLDPDHPPADFTGVYRYALVEYGIDKPQPILELFQQKEIIQAFRQAFEQKDRSILLREGENFLDWNILGDRIRELNINVQQELADFQVVFINVANSTRTPADVIQSQKIDNLENILEAVVNKLLTTLSVNLDESSQQLLEKATKVENNYYHNRNLKLILDSEKTYGKFIARTNDTNKVLKYLENPDTNKVVSLVGLGGIGKTSLCHHIAMEAIRKDLFKKIFWIRAKKMEFSPSNSGEIRVVRQSTLTFEQALIDISENISDITNNIRENHSKLKVHIANALETTPSLIVIDGLEDSENPSILSQDFKPLLGNSRLILTSRELVKDSVFSWDVSKLDRIDSQNFIKIVANELGLPIFFEEDSSTLERILSLTDGMPLAMKLVISNYAYLDLERIAERLSLVSEEKKLYSYLFEGAWLKLKEQCEINAICILLFLSRNISNVVRKDLYNAPNLYNEVMSASDIDSGIRVLKNLSLIEISTNNVISLHSLTSNFFQSMLVEGVF
jgi:ABC-type uncharacterized transport system YnjBCD ATPase subunit